MPKARPLRILIVDDNDLSRALLRVILRGDEHDIVGEAISVQQAIQMCQTMQPDVVLLDILMPGVPGLDAIGPLKKIRPQARILMVSANDDDDNVKRAMEEGADGFIAKPFNSASILQTMQHMADTFTFAAPATLAGLS
ncbi:MULTISPECIES: response regulator [unclassified Janthinobacterium]|uniref:Response regulator n=1 Tax=Janthinobacterium lividum TaxID=29581 RepID=A0A1E8PLG5_9BURK|nr:response regulator [Janthinobacterium sp. CG_23.4]MDH6157354.1 DNA-binding NarL/FixJ family response regulator [Janthinobacterium sp. CG_23.4]OFJ47116.1 response regulator [Janthinobacterium lividum]